MSPPQLAADAPVLDVLQPVAVRGDVFLRIELYLAFQYGWQGNLGEVLHREEPLLAQTWLYGGVLVALAIAHLVLIVFDALHESGLLQVDGNLLAHLHAVHTYVESALLGDGAVGVEDVYGLQVVCLAEVVVVHVVGRCHLEASRTELDVYVAVFDDWYHSPYQGHDDLVSA